MSESRCSVCGQPALLLDLQGRCASCGLPTNTMLHVATESIVYPAPPAPPPPKSRAIEGDLVGRELGGCRLSTRIGGGGMGVVYKAEQLSLARTVAVKLLRNAGLGDQTFIARFRSEARVVAALNHPNILHIHDVGVEAELHYIVMEYVDGPSLRALIGRGLEQDARRCRALLEQCLHGLAHAHAAGIIHRDLKPDNILVGTGDRLKLADFGLAKLLHGNESLTATGVVLGTPLYMSPEAARGEALDARADLYSLGASFYHVLAGIPPFSAETPMGILYRQINDPLPALSTVNPAADPQLVRIIERLLAKPREARFQDCAEVLAALGALGPAGAQASSSPEAARPQASTGVSTIQATGRLPASGSVTSGVVMGSRRGTGWFAAVALLALLVGALSPAGQDALQSLWRSEPSTATPVVSAPATPKTSPVPDSTPRVPRTPPLVAPARIPEPTQLMKAPVSTIVPEPSPESAEQARVRARCEALLRHLARRDFGALADFLPGRKAGPVRPLLIAQRIRKILQLPAPDQIKSIAIVEVSVGAEGVEATTRLDVRLTEEAAVRQSEIVLRWKKLQDGEWRLQARDD